MLMIVKFNVLIFFLIFLITILIKKITVSYAIHLLNFKRIMFHLLIS